MSTSKNRVVAYLSDDTYKYICDKAEEENRSVSNYIEHLIQMAIRADAEKKTD